MSHPAGPEGNFFPEPGASVVRYDRSMRAQQPLPGEAHSLGFSAGSDPAGIRDAIQREPGPASGIRRDQSPRTTEMASPAVSLRPGEPAILASAAMTLEGPTGEQPLHREGEPLPPIHPGEIVHQTPNFRVVTDYKPGLDGQAAGAAFFLMPHTDAGVGIIIRAAKAHNIYDFSLRPRPDTTREGAVVPVLRADYIAKNAAALLQGDVQIPEHGKATIPSPDRMEACILINPYAYTFSADLPPNYRMFNPNTRSLRLLQVLNQDDIPERVIHSADGNPYYKVRKGFWHSVGLYLNVGLRSGEFSDPAVAEQIKTFLGTYGDEFLRRTRLTTSEDIAAVNGLINTIWHKYGMPTTTGS